MWGLKLPTARQSGSTSTSRPAWSAAWALKSGTRAMPRPSMAASRRASLLLAPKGPVTGTVMRAGAVVALAAAAGSKCHAGVSWARG